MPCERGRACAAVMALRLFGLRDDFAFFTSTSHQHNVDVARSVFRGQSLCGVVWCSLDSVKARCRRGCS